MPKILHQPEEVKLQAWIFQSLETISNFNKEESVGSLRYIGHIVYKQNKICVFFFF